MAGRKETIQLRAWSLNALRIKVWIKKRQGWSYDPRTRFRIEHRSSRYRKSVRNEWRAKVTKWKPPSSATTGLVRVRQSPYKQPDTPPDNAA